MRRPLFSLTLALAMTAAPLVAGCGAGQMQVQAPEPAPKQKLGKEFPTRSELAGLGQAPLPKAIFGEGAVDVDTWKLRGPFPAGLEDRPLEPSTPWDQMLADATKKRSDVTATEAMQCAARETAVFLVEKKGLPPMPLQQFISARCGMPEGMGGISAWTRELKGELPIEKIFAETKGEIAKLIEGGVGAGAQQVGLYFGREKDTVVGLVVSRTRRVKIDPTPFVPEGGKVVLRGELLAPAGSVHALVNQGSFGYARCAEDPAVVLPRFAVTCDVAPDDPSAWIQVAAFENGRILGHDVINTLVFPKGEPNDTFAFRIRKAEDAAAVDAGALQQSLVEEINRRRAEGNLGPLALDETQSRTTTTLAPYFFAATFGSIEERIADKVVLGVRAGWDVGGLVRKSDTSSVIVSAAASPREIIDAAVMKPAGRTAIFDPAAARIAIGPATHAEVPMMGLLFATYTLMDAKQHDKDAAVVLDKLTKARAERGMPPPSQIAGASAIASRVSLEVSRGLKAPEQGLQDLLDQASANAGRSLRGFLVQGYGLEGIQFPKEMLTTPGLAVSVVVTHSKEPDEPWARLVVLVLVDAAGGLRSASHTPLSPAPAHVAGLGPQTAL